MNLKIILMLSLVINIELSIYTYAEDETKYSLTYYPAPYGLYDDISVTKAMGIGVLPAEGNKLLAVGADSQAPIGSYSAAVTGYISSVFGIYAESASNHGICGYGTLYGVKGYSGELRSGGIYAQSTNHVAGYGYSSSGVGVYGSSSSTDAVWGRSTSGTGVYVNANVGLSGVPVVYALSAANSNQHAALRGESIFTEGIYINALNGDSLKVNNGGVVNCVRSVSISNGSSCYGMYAKTDAGDNVVNARSVSGYGITGIGGGTQTCGVTGVSASGIGVYGESLQGGDPAFPEDFSGAGIYGHGFNRAYGIIGFSVHDNAIYARSGYREAVKVIVTSNPAVPYSFGTAAVVGESTYGPGVTIRDSYGPGIISSAAGEYDIYAAGTGIVYAKIKSFTGAHRIKYSSQKGIIPGLILVSSGRIERENKEYFIANITTAVELAEKEKDKRVFGVFSKEIEPDGNPIGERTGAINGLGDGLVWVTDINGKIKNGEYITTSSIPGYGQRQDDKILHNYTVGKIIEDIDWDSVKDTIEYNGKKYKKYLAGITYHCG